MKHVYHLAEAHVEQPSLVTIGVFDGVHIGHQHLIRRLVEDAHANNRLAVVLTFFPHPDVVLRGLQGRYYLMSPEQRADELGKLGVDLVITHPFDDVVRQIRAAEFVDMMVEHLKIDALWVGSDFAMGYKREGNVDFLRAQGQQKGFSLNVIDLIVAEGATISSTAIRDALLHGAVEQVREWLGRAYEVEGEVVHGQERGRKLGFPTANIEVWSKQVIPANGIYAGWATIGDERFMAMTNVGIRPTFDDEGITVEAYLLDFNRDVYGQKMRLSFDMYLRPEAKFDNIQALIDKIAEDVEAGRAYLTQQEHASGD
jgi:riboflavin kinase / FMN adenylyltransferase